jgi:hypothetical protein
MSDTEQWTWVRKFPSYKISSHGRVKSYKTGRPKIMTPSIAGNGYPVVNLYYGEEGYTTRTLHSLVAEHFLERPESAECVNHLDGDKTNPHVDNLEWTTIQGNNEHARAAGLSYVHGAGNGSSKLLPDHVRDIRRRGDAGEHPKSIAKDYPVTASQARRIIKRQNWKFLT